MPNPTISTITVGGTTYDIVDDASFPIDVSDNTNNVTGILNVANGGTGNSSGYVRAGQKANTTIGTCATAEGTGVTASGDYSHGEGADTTVQGMYAHVEGTHSTASGVASHAEGNTSQALGMYSHAEGTYTVAKGDNSHTQGKFNIRDDNNTYAHIVGNGTSNIARSNAHTLDWNGNAWFAGNVEDGNNNTISKNSEDLRYYESAGYLGRNLWRGATTLSGSGSIGYSRAESKTNKIIISGKISSTTSGTLTFDLNSYNDSTQTGSYTTYSFLWSGQKTDYAFTPILQTLGDGYHLTSCSVSSNVDITLTDFQIEDGETAHIFTKYVPAIPTIVNDRYLHTNATTGNLEWVQGGGGSSATVLGGTLVAGNTTITFTDNAITATAMIDIYTSDKSVGWIDRTVSGTTLTLIFPPQSSDLAVRVRLEETGE